MANQNPGKKRPARWNSGLVRLAILAISLVPVSVVASTAFDLSDWQSWALPCSALIVLWGGKLTARLEADANQ